MFASLVTEVVEIETPRGPAAVTVQKLSARSLDKCREARFETTARGMRTMGGELLKALRDPEAVAAARQAGADLTDEALAGIYDRDTVLLSGVRSWEGPGVAGFTPAADMDKLDEDAADLLFVRILRLSIKTKAQREAETKNA